MRDNTKRIFIVDDNASHSAGIRQLLEIDGTTKVVGIAHNGQDALQKIDATGVDIILMDMNMPGLDGVSTIEQINTKYPHIRILALTGYDDPDLVYRAMQAGARGYVLKTMITSQLQGAINEVVQGKIYLPINLATKFFGEFHLRKTGDQPQNDPQRQAILNYLTNREKEVLALLTEGYTYKNVADRLVISETTVKTHVNNIFQKLQVNDRTQAVLYAIKHGLVPTEKMGAAKRLQQQAV